MAAITQGNSPLQLPGGMANVATMNRPNEPLESSVVGKFVPKPRKPPKPKKHAFGPSAYGAAFKK